MKDTIFENIAQGKIESYKIYEDELTCAFLDINPTSKGHTLVIPKKNYIDIFEIPERELKALAISIKKVSIILKEKLNAKGVNILNASGKVAQQSVFHLHFHILPRYEGDGLNMWPEGKDKNDISKIHEMIMK